MTLPNPSVPLIDNATRCWLLQCARQAIAAHFTRTRLLLPDHAPMAAEQLRGCFISLQTLEGALRGCVGTFDATQPLWSNVREFAVAAATRDHRFVPLRANELETCVIEISVLSTPQRASVGGIRVGTHGLCIEQGVYRGVLLPQVAVAYGWDVPTFLQQTCVKAGLQAAAWRDESVDIYTFTAEAFTEVDRLL